MPALLLGISEIYVSASTITDYLKIKRIYITIINEGNVGTNVIVRCIRLNIVFLGKQLVLHILCPDTHIYPECKAHPRYYIFICGLSSCTKF